ncbi:LYR motif-containing protein [Ananas comosus]|uniref:LYR motif-containing protein n=1 Tax=Ananas comosus TaxID=4615 RepID=A0A199VCH2_ANACO|nr:LYR motif-containing protein [Ananas comosus]
MGAPPPPRSGSRPGSRAAPRAAPAPETRAYYAKYARENFVNYRDADPSTSLSDLLRRAYAHSTWVLNKYSLDESAVAKLKEIYGFGCLYTPYNCDLGQLLKLVKVSNDAGDSAIMGIVDIDNDKANPQMCSLYASEIYTNLCATEVNDIAKELDILLSSIEQGGFWDACTVLQQTSVMTLEEGLQKLSAISWICKVAWTSLKSQMAFVK